MTILLLSSLNFWCGAGRGSKPATTLVLDLPHWLCPSTVVFGPKHILFIWGQCKPDLLPIPNPSFPDLHFFFVFLTRPPPWAAAEVHAHLTPVPPAEQPSCQGGSVPDRQEALWQHLCLPVRRVGTGGGGGWGGQQII